MNMRARLNVGVRRERPAVWWLLSLAVGVVLCVPTVADDVCADGLLGQTEIPLTGFTKPYREVTLAALQTGRVAALPVEEGRYVAAGALAAKLDDTVQMQRVGIARALAESTFEIELARVRCAQAERELERLRGLRGVSTVSTKELADAEANAAAAGLELQQAHFKHAQALREFALQRALLEELHVKTPFAGYVAERLCEVGDTVEEREGILTLVQLDPLVVTIDCPLERVADLTTGQTVRLIPTDTAQPPREGEVVFVSRVADAASQTLKVKVHVPNPKAEWLAGMQVRVALDAGSQASAAWPQDTESER
jgi:RND family efflux transporter MFP subunit